MDSYEFGSEDKYTQNVIDTLATLEGDLETLIEIYNKKIAYYDKANRLDDLAKDYVVTCQKIYHSLKEKVYQVKETNIESTNLRLTLNMDSKPSEF